MTLMIIASNCQGALLWSFWMDWPTSLKNIQASLLSCSIYCHLKVCDLSLGSPRKVAASPTTPQFLSPTAQRSLFSSSFTNTVSFALLASEKGCVFLAAFVIYSDLLINHSSFWWISLTPSSEIFNAEVLFREDSTPDEFIDVIVGNRVYMPCLYVCTSVSSKSLFNSLSAFAWSLFSSLFVPFTGVQ